MKLGNKGISAIGMVLVAVVVIAGVGAGAYYLLSDDNDKDYMTYDISGTVAGGSIEGTMKITILSETETQYEAKMAFDMEITVNGITTPLKHSMNQWFDKNEDDQIAMGEPLRQEELDTKYGKKNVNVYSESVSGMTMTAYIGQEDSVIYKLDMNMSVSGVTMNMSMTLKSTNMA